VAKDVLEIASLNGARAAGLEAEIGSLEVGKRADIVIRANDIPEAFPLTDPIAQTVYSSRSKSVLTVLVDGEIVVENRQPTRVDLTEVFADVQASTRRVFERMGYHL
jgi:cytosine/adenosine deaminase-related metal-dependent hydrolase